MKMETKDKQNSTVTRVNVVAARQELKKKLSAITPNESKQDVKALDAKQNTAKAKDKKQPVAYIVYLTKLIEQGKFTQKELFEKGVKEFPTVAKSTIATVLTDSKNPKYNRFPKLTVKAADGVLKFK